MRVKVDCSNAVPAELDQRYNITGFPTVLFVTADGEMIERLGARDPASVRTQILRILEEHGPARFDVPEGEIETGMADARQAGKLLAIVFMEADDAQAAEALALGLATEEIAEARDRYVWILRPVRDDRNRVTEEAREWGASRSGTIVLVDPWAEGDDRLLGDANSVRAAGRALERAWEDAQERGHPPGE